MKRSYTKDDKTNVKKRRVTTQANTQTLNKGCSFHKILITYRKHQHKISNGQLAQELELSSPDQINGQMTIFFFKEEEFRFPILHILEMMSKTQEKIYNNIIKEMQEKDLDKTFNVYSSLKGRNAFKYFMLSELISIFEKYYRNNEQAWESENIDPESLSQAVLQMLQWGHANFNSQRAEDIGLHRHFPRLVGWFQYYFAEPSIPEHSITDYSILEILDLIRKDMGEDCKNKAIFLEQKYMEELSTYFLLKENSSVLEKMLISLAKKLEDPDILEAINKQNEFNVKLKDFNPSEILASLRNAYHNHTQSIYLSNLSLFASHSSNAINPLVTKPTIPL